MPFTSARQTHRGRGARSRSWSCGRRYAVEEIDQSRLDVILGADDEQAIARDELFEDLGAVAQVIRRGADVGTHALLDERIAIVPQIRREEGGDGRAHSIDDRS